MFTLKLESGTRRIYETESGALAVEVSTNEHAGIKRGAMEVYLKNGWVDRFMDKTLGVQTYFKLPNGVQIGELFNPTIRNVSARSEIDFDWLLEATQENEARLLEEIGRRYRAWLDLVSTDLGNGDENRRAERTCEIVEDEDGYSSCSECGANYLCMRDASFCPDCGAKVVWR